MRLPECPDHGRLALDLAQGRLEDHAALEAESVTSSCPTCSGWWRQHLDGELAASLDAAVETAIAEFRPARRRVRTWMPVAAAAVLAVGAGALWYGGSGRTYDQPNRGALIQESFDSDVNGDGTVDTSDLGFTVHIIGQPSAAAPAAGSGEVIFADSLDSGDLAGWTSKT